MNPNSLRVVLAIPNYKNRESLKELITSPAVQNFDHIYILDDMSEDPEIAQLASSRISVIESNIRLFVTPNRNRILQYDMGDILVFADSDAYIKTTNAVRILKRLYSENPQLGILSGELRRLNNSVEWYSYGKFLSPFDMQKLESLVTLAEQNTSDLSLLEKIKKVAAPYSYNFWSLTSGTKVDWTSGAFYTVRSSLFQKLNGFDPDFVMYHEEPDLCLRASQLGYYTYWTPEIQVVHKKNDNIGIIARNNFMEQSNILWYRKHFGINEDTYRKLKVVTLI